MGQAGTTTVRWGGSEISLVFEPLSRSESCPRRPTRIGVRSACPTLRTTDCRRVHTVIRDGQEKDSNSWRLMFPLYKSGSCFRTILLQSSRSLVEQRDPSGCFVDEQDSDDSA